MCETRENADFISPDNVIHDTPNDSPFEEQPDEDDEDDTTNFGR